MKASLKFREEQKPVIRAKVPLSILGLPFQSGIVAGESKELTLNLSTFFESGPSIKISYRPNDTWNPFSLIVKTGTGPFGSPISSSMLMSAEFSFLGKGNPRNPSFMIHFKPQFGDFSIKKSQSSVFDKVLTRQNGAVSEEVESPSSIDVVDVDVDGGSVYSPEKRKIAILPSTVPGDFARLLSGVEFAARTALPVRGRAVVNFRWGVRVPAGGESTAGIAFKKIPFLVMNKIGVEHVAGGDDSKGGSKAKVVGPVPDVSFAGNADVAEACFNVKRQLEVLQADNGLLKKAVEELRQEIGSGKSSISSSIGDLNSGKYREKMIDRRNNEKKSAESDVKGVTGA